MEAICKIVIQFQTFGRNVISPIYRLMEQFIRGFCFGDDVLEELKSFASIYIIQKLERGDIIDTHTFEKLTHIDIEPHTSYCFAFITNARVLLSDCDVKEQQNLIFKFTSFLLFLNDAVPVYGFHSLYFINEKDERHNYISNDSIATPY